MKSEILVLVAKCTIDTLAVIPTSPSNPNSKWLFTRIWDTLKLPQALGAKREAIYHKVQQWI